VQHLISGPRLPFTCTYFASIALTLYFSIGVSSIFSVHCIVTPVQYQDPAAHTAGQGSREVSKCHFLAPYSSKTVQSLLQWQRRALDIQGFKTHANGSRVHVTRSSFQLQSTFLTLIAAIVQIVALLWYLVSYFPMGSTGLRYAASFGGNRVAAWMRD
jgi:hypothetical protein